MEHQLLTRDLIAPTIYRLAPRRGDWQDAYRDVEVTFRQTARGRWRALVVRMQWSLASLAQEREYWWTRQDLSKLAHTKNEEAITELAALGVAFALVMVLLPRDKITKVVPKGDRGDFYLNGTRDQMIEISGTLRGDLNRRFSEKKRQILLNRNLRRAIVNVSRFAEPASRLERVR